MLLKPLIGAQMSGSIGGVTIARNRGGQYARVRTVPVNPSTPAQVTVRAAMGAAATAWGTILTSAQRLAWEEYAANSPVVNRLGDPLVLSGQQMYIRCNTPRIQEGTVSRVDDGPTIFGLDNLNPVTITPQSGGQDVLVGFDDAQDWRDEDEALLVVGLSRQQSPTINYWRGPYRIGDYIEGSIASPPPTGTAITNPYGVDYVLSNKVFGRVFVSRADGRLSNVLRVSGVVTAP